MDLLSEILDTVSLRGQIYFRTSFNGEWAVAVPPHNNAVRFHYVLKGQCYAGLSSGPRISLSSGDLILVPSGAAHDISDSPNGQADALEDILVQSNFSGRGALCLGTGEPESETQLICGHFTFAEGSQHPLLRALPAMLHITSRIRAESFWLNEALHLMTRQLDAGALGSDAAVRRMSEVIFIEAIRASADQSESLSRLMDALTDPKISRAISAIHRLMDRPWTVDSLATEAAMSRSRFAERFQELVGCGPLSYLTEWRMQRARNLLAGSQASIQEIAGGVGYQSPAAFTRAFASMFGEPPTSYRRRIAA